MPFVFAGGVMCNSIIKNKLRSKFDAHFAEPLMSADNAVGIAELTRISFTK
jgi:tRNA A37 threonylcarbamoyltransferase TsaD